MILDKELVLENATFKGCPPFLVQDIGNGTVFKDEFPDVIDRFHCGPVGINLTDFHSLGIVPVIDLLIGARKGDRTGKIEVVVSDGGDVFVGVSARSSISRDGRIPGL